MTAAAACPSGGKSGGHPRLVVVFQKAGQLFLIIMTRLQMFVHWPDMAVPQAVVRPFHRHSRIPAVAGFTADDFEPETLSCPRKTLQNSFRRFSSGGPVILGQDRCRCSATECCSRRPFGRQTLIHHATGKRRTVRRSGCTAMNGLNPAPRDRKFQDRNNVIERISGTPHFITLQST